jgi:Radical SAM superfamily
MASLCARQRLLAAYLFSEFLHSDRILPLDRVCEYFVAIAISQEHGVAVPRTGGPVLIQIEITTHCNYQCFYCAGRHMRQAHMPWSRFNDIMAQLPAAAREVSLQGEGEPLLHPRFWDMAQMVRDRDLAPYTITNGSHIDPERLAAHFPAVGISIDTLDAALAATVGRFKLERVLENLDALLQFMPADRIIIHTVYFGQPLNDLSAYLSARGLTRHLIQEIQPKADYASNYGVTAPVTDGPCTYQCSYLDEPRMRYYSLNGVELPCCFIKDTSDFVSIEHLRKHLAAKSVPRSCEGCRMIFPQSRFQLSAFTTVSRAATASR